MCTRTCTKYNRWYMHSWLIVPSSRVSYSYTVSYPRRSECFNTQTTRTLTRGPRRSAEFSIQTYVLYVYVRGEGICEAHPVNCGKLRARWYMAAGTYTMEDGYPRVRDRVPVPPRFPAPRDPAAWYFTWNASVSLPILLQLLSNSHFSPFSSRFSYSYFEKDSHPRKHFSSRCF